jgi:E1A/CREB-binding protein
MSSRFCLSHFRQCTEANCEICAPVKAHISENRAPGSQAVSGVVRPRTDGTTDASAAKYSKPGEGSAAGGSSGSSSQQTQQFLERQKQAYAVVVEKYNAAKAAGNEAEMNNCMREIHTIRQQINAAAQRKPGPRIDGDCTLVATFNKDEIISHVSTLRLDNNRQCTAENIRNRVTPILSDILSQDHAAIFNHAVDPVRDHAPGYFDIIKRPMDLSKIKKQLDSTTYYTTFRDFCEDMRLVWRNAMTYNPPNTPVNAIASKLSNLFEKRWREIEQFLQKDFNECVNDKSGNHCSLCGNAKLFLVPPSVYCNHCNTRLKKGQPYYTTRNNKYHLCTTCHSAVRRGAATLTFDDQPIRINDLKKGKPDVSAEESWVQCDFCQKWQHQVCALYNGKRNEGLSIPHYCPHCIIGHMGARHQPSPISKPVRGAKDMPETQLSKHIESRLQALLESKRSLFAADQEREASDIEMPQFVFRVVSCVDKVNYNANTQSPLVLCDVSCYLVVQTIFPVEEVLRRYSQPPHNYPSQLNFRSKCLLLFQRIGGVDVMLYALYVQEYGDDCPPPNKRCAYLSYLDSVRYLQPSSLRTAIYQEILIAYIEDLKHRGFNQMTLWSCPPQRGDDYIFYAHPEMQKTPKADRLREWYLTTMDAAVKRGAVEKVMFLVDDYFPSISPYGLNYPGHASVEDKWWQQVAPVDPSPAAAHPHFYYGPHAVGREEGADRALSELPYCEGDYWPGSIPTFFKELQDELAASGGSIDIAPPPAVVSIAEFRAAHGLDARTGAGAPGTENPSDSEDDGIVGLAGPEEESRSLTPAGTELLTTSQPYPAAAAANRGKAGKKGGKQRGRGRGRGGRLRSAGPAAPPEALANVNHHPDTLVDRVTGKCAVIGVDGKPMPIDLLRDKVAQKVRQYSSFTC